MTDHLAASDAATYAGERRTAGELWPVDRRVRIEPRADRLNLLRHAVRLLVPHDRIGGLGMRNAHADESERGEQREQSMASKHASLLWLSRLGRSGRDRYDCEEARAQLFTKPTSRMRA
jgi:hypothetical protein